MSKVSHRVPSYRHHKARNCAVVTIRGRNHYLGRFGSAESKERYARLIAEWSGSGRAEPSGPSTGSTLTMCELVNAYWKFASEYYLAPDGKPAKEQAKMREALRPLVELYSTLPVAQFGPLALKATRERMIARGWTRKHINHQVNRLRRVFKWATENELIPPAVIQGLKAVSPLKAGRCAAPEPEPVRPVPDEWVDPVIRVASPQVAAMIELQRLTGMRGGEVVLMRAADIDTSGPVWLFEPGTHKNQWRGARRIVPLGPRAQEIVARFFGLDPQAFLFSPKAATEWRHEQQRANRKSKVQPSQVSRKRRRPEKEPGESYDTYSYRRAVKYAIGRANAIETKAAKQEGREPKLVASWHPHQLRHSHGTAVRRRYGLEGAQVALGHAHAAVSEIYAERNLDLAVKIASEIG